MKRSGWIVTVLNYFSYMVTIKEEIKYLRRFSLAGLINTFLGYCLIFLLMFLGVGPYLSNGVAYGVGIVLSFFLNKHFVFRSKEKFLGTGIKFLLLMLGAYFINLCVLNQLLKVGMNPYLSQVVAGLIYSGGVYLFSRKWVF